jgi:uncharacterized protein (TIGR03086 family)
MVVAKSRRQVTVSITAPPVERNHPFCYNEQNDIFRSAGKFKEAPMTAIATTWPILDTAHEALRRTVAGLSDADWDLSTPCEQWNVAQVLRHSAGDQLAYASAITGSGGPTENPFDPSPGRPQDAAAFLESALAGSARAFSGVARGARDVPSPLPQGAMDADVVVGAAALDAAVHAWDIAAASGQPSPLTDDLAARLHPVATAIVEPLRAYGAYAAVVAGPDADGHAAALLRYLGRNPAWTR